MVASRRSGRRWRRYRLCGCDGCAVLDRATSGAELLLVLYRRCWSGRVLGSLSALMEGRADAARKNADHRHRGSEMAQRLLAGWHLRGRVLWQFHQLCRQGRGAVFLVRRSLPSLWRFSDAGMHRLSPRSDDRRPKSAKARSRGRFGTGGAASAMRNCRRYST
jgi:hypothetical protein